MITFMVILELIDLLLMVTQTQARTIRIHIPLSLVARAQSEQS